MDSFLQTLRNLGTARLAAFGVAAVVIVGGLLYMASTFSSQGMGLLYDDLAPADGGAIIQQLEAQNIPYRASPDGTRIEVPTDQVGRLRMQLADQGLPSGGTVGYEIFNEPEALGTTNFMQNVQSLRALEGELVRTVKSLQPVMEARIHIVPPKRELFSRQTQTATASVFLRLRPGAQLTREQILSIQTLVAAAVPQLEPGMVSVIDDKGNLLARGMGSDSQEALAATAEERRLAYERRLQQRVEDLLARTVGIGRVRAEVAAELDFDKIVTNSEIYDPESQVVRGTQTVTEESEAQDRDGIDPVTVANNLPNGDDTAAGSVGSSTSRSSRTEETTNYEISRTVRTHEREAGQIRRLSVAVLVDGTYTTAEDGTQTYQPRPDADLEQLRRLVAAAIPYDGARGDVIEISSMQFAVPETDFGDGETKILGLPVSELRRIGETVILAIVAVLVILVVIRPLVQRALDRTPQLEEEPDLLADASAVPQLAGPGGGALARELALEAAQANEELEQMIDINRVDGRVRASSLRKVGEIVEKHPEEAVSIIRNWLYQES
ncbi:flagellar basal-body MS-ring/collar protein FliF [Indioceanicola profundi]|uniref:flagellar basal-body MS-ring/collar protein FliF n=1 Tax=Indioceanicola profundi TaxID=2220096 RepID=UPI000E6ACC7E|nr:flagellar basal-body MS-ring/collar protein FliF [Indioceanicola profundi]